MKLLDQLSFALWYLLQLRLIPEALRAGYFLPKCQILHPPRNPSFCNMFVYYKYFSPYLHSSHEGAKVVATDIHAIAWLIGFPLHAKRQRGDSNPCGQSPMDFESISLTARTHCHMFTENNGLLWIRWLPHRCERLWHSEGSCLVPSVTQPSGWSRLNNSKKLSSIMLEQALEGIEQTVCPRIGAPK